MIFLTIASDKGKLAVKRGLQSRESQQGYGTVEIVWLPKVESKKTGLSFAIRPR